MELKYSFVDAETQEEATRLQRFAKALFLLVLAWIALGLKPELQNLESLGP